jgi:nitrite reductase/ring-hydroxylating ferredoxin subunit
VDMLFLALLNCSAVTVISQATASACHRRRFQWREMVVFFVWCNGKMTSLRSQWKLRHFQTLLQIQCLVTVGQSVFISRPSDLIYIYPSNCPHSFILLSTHLFINSITHSSKRSTVHQSSYTNAFTKTSVDVNFAQAPMERSFVSKL